MYAYVPRMTVRGVGDGAADAHLRKAVLCVDDEKTSLSAATIADDDELAFEVWTTGVHG